MLRLTKVAFPFFAFLLFSLALFAQSAPNVTIKVIVVDQQLSIKPVPKFAFVVSKSDDATFSEQKISTSLEGVATLTLPAGDYVVRSERPLDFSGKQFTWEHKFTVAADKPLAVELSNDNAKISETPVNSQSVRRRVSEEGEMFKSLRDGVVTIEGELGTGTGFIIDRSGMILTNQHVISRSTEVRVRFDKNTAVRARVRGEDAERDIAVLQINLSAFPNARVLRMPDPNSGEAPVIEGERVFAIGSPLNQDKILTAGIVSKVEDRAIISDVAINPGNSGGPLFNSLGEVVGLTTFGVQGGGGPGIAGIVRIEEAKKLIDAALDKTKDLSPMSVDLVPNMPDDTFPVDAIKAKVDVKKFPTKQYRDDIKDYQINYFTPVFKFYVSEKDRLESLKNRNRRNQEKGAVNTADPYKNLRNWNEYAGELKPVVEIFALPEIAVTGKSMALAILTSATVGVSTPLDLKLKADFYQMKLMCDGSEVVPLRKNKAEFGIDLQNYYKIKRRYSYAGLYTYPYETFEPGRCKQLLLQVFSEEDLEKPIVTEVKEATKQRIWSDFAEYRTQTMKN